MKPAHRFVLQLQAQKHYYHAGALCAHLNVNLAGDGPDARPKVVKTRVLHAEPVGEVAGVGEGRAQAYKSHLVAVIKGARFSCIV